MLIKIYNCITEGLLFNNNILKAYSIKLQFLIITITISDPRATWEPLKNLEILVTHSPRGFRKKRHFSAGANLSADKGAILNLSQQGKLRSCAKNDKEI